MKHLLTILACIGFLTPGFARAWNGENAWNLSGMDMLADQPVPPGMDLVRIADLTSDQNKNTFYLELMVDRSNKVTGLYVSADPDNAPGEDEGGTNVHWLADFESSQGATLKMAKGRRALIMNGTLNRQTQEGKFSLRYLANGLSMQYKSCDLWLRKSGSRWIAENAYTKSKISNVHVKTWAMGITTVEGVCPN